MYQCRFFTELSDFSAGRTLIISSNLNVMRFAAFALLFCFAVSSVFSDTFDRPDAPPPPPPHVAVIGAGYAGLTAALELRKQGYTVTVYERLPRVGGRVARFQAPSPTSDRIFDFGEGPSWYAMPDLMDSIFARYHASGRADLFSTIRLDPSYRIRLPSGKVVDVPADLDGIYKLAGPARSPGLRRLFKEAKYKYKQGISDWLWRPLVSPYELVSPNLIWAALSSDMFGGYESHVRRHVDSNEFAFAPLSAGHATCCADCGQCDLTDDDWVTILKWPVIFLGASPRSAPAMYSLITYALHALGIWWPDGGMDTPALALGQVARNNGVRFELSTEVTALQTSRQDMHRISSVCIRPTSALRAEKQSSNCIPVDAVVGAADYEHVEQALLPLHLRRYDTDFWRQATMSPSCLIFHLGFEQPAGAEADPHHPVTALFASVLLHHTYYFDKDLDAYLRAVFDDQAALDEPASLDSMAFYVAAPFPPGLMILLPVSFRSNGTDMAHVRAKILEIVLRRLTLSLPAEARARLGGDNQSLAPAYSRGYGMQEYGSDFNAFRGNAFGLANTMQQSLLWRPSLSGKAKNMVFAGCASAMV
jgi:phytoene desaturase